MTQPAYLSAVNIKCMTKDCQQIVRSNGVTIVQHLVLHHKISKGETGLLCRRHAGNNIQFTGPEGNWTVGEWVNTETV